MPTKRHFGISVIVLMLSAIIGALDMWKRAADTYKLNFPNSIVYQTRAESLSPQCVAQDIGTIDILLASPECTNHSVAKGSRPRIESSRATAFEVIRFAKVLRPRWIIVENVIQMQTWARFKEWRGELEHLGYQTKVGVLDAQRHGTPQSRRRLFVVCDLERMPNFPSLGTPTTMTVKSSVLGKGEPCDGGWRFSNLDCPRRAKATIERAHRAFEALGDKTPFIMVYYGTDGAGGFQSLNRPLRTITTLDRFAYVRPHGDGHEMRMLQPTELAAAMGFPVSHNWGDSSRRERIKLIGNAVCPRVMKDVVRALTGN